MTKNMQGKRRFANRLVRFAMMGAMTISLTCLLTACHGSRKTADFEIPEQLDTDRQYELTFWAKNDTNKAQTDIYEKAIKDFETLYPNVHITVRLYTDYSRIYNDVITNISTNTTPNVCITYPDHIATYISGQNVVVPLDNLMVDEKYGLGGSELRFTGPRLDEMVPKFLEEGCIRDTQYAIPYMRSTEACYVNQTYVEKLGYTVPDVLTWDFIWEVSDAAMAQDTNGNYKVNGQKVLIPFIYKSTDNMMIQMLYQKGAGYSTAEGEVNIFSDDTKEILYTIANHVEKGSFSTFKISSYPANFLNAGQCIFAIDSTAGATWMGTNAPLSDIDASTLVEFDTVVRPIPQFDPENMKMISQGPSICVFQKTDPQEVLMSWLFAQFLLTDEVQIAYAETEGYVPVTKKAQENADYQDYLSRIGEDNKEHYEIKIQATKLLLEHVDETFVTPVFNGSASLRDASGQMIENTAKAIRRHQIVDETFMTKLFDDINSLYRLDQKLGQGRGGSGTKEDLGPMPAASVLLLVSLVVAWAGIITCFICEKRKKQK